MSTQVARKNCQNFVIVISLSKTKTHDFYELGNLCRKEGENDTIHRKEKGE